MSGTGANTYTNTYAYCDTYTYTYCDTYTYAYCDTYTNTYTNTHTCSNGYILDFRIFHLCYIDSHANTVIDTYSHANTHANTDWHRWKRRQHVVCIEFRKWLAYGLQPYH